MNIKKTILKKCINIIENSIYFHKISIIEGYNNILYNGFNSKDPNRFNPYFQQWNPPIPNNITQRNAEYFNTKNKINNLRSNNNQLPANYNDNNHLNNIEDKFNDEQLKKKQKENEKDLLNSKNNQLDKINQQKKTNISNLQLTKKETNNQANKQSIDSQIINLRNSIEKNNNQKEKNQNIISK